MNKAFVKEPEFDGRAYCPVCGSLGTQVGEAVLDTHITSEARHHLDDSAWFCGFARCDVAYFDLFEAIVRTSDLCQPVFPKELDAPICACFGFTLDDLDADVDEGKPTRIRELLEKTKSPDADCATRAADGRCCMQQVQRLYMKRISPSVDD